MPHRDAQHTRTLLILDLDETLIHASDHLLDRPADFTVYGYHAYRRPFLDANYGDTAIRVEQADITGLSFTAQPS